MSSDRILIIVILAASISAVLVIVIDRIFPAYNIASIASAGISIIAASVAIYQFREETKISRELSMLGQDSGLGGLTNLQRDAVLRHKARRKRVLEDRRLFIVVIIVVMIAMSEIIACANSILD